MDNSSQKPTLNSLTPRVVNSDAGGDDDRSHSTGAELRQVEDVGLASRSGIDNGNDKGNEQGTARSDEKPTTFGASKDRHSSDMKIPPDHVPARSIEDSAIEVSRANNTFVTPGCKEVTHWTSTRFQGPCALVRLIYMRRPLPSFPPPGSLARYSVLVELRHIAGASSPKRHGTSL